MVSHLSRPAIELEHVGDVTLVKFGESELLDEESIQQIAAELYKLAERPECRHLVLNLDSVSKISTQMLGTFFTLHRKLKSTGGKLVVCRVDQGLREIFSLMKLPHFVTLYEDEQEALQAFSR